eukprot:4769186-Pleurochrysis_carterae.AAC.9
MSKEVAQVPAEGAHRRLSSLEPRRHAAIARRQARARAAVAAPHLAATHVAAASLARARARHLRRMPRRAQQRLERRLPRPREVVHPVGVVHPRVVLAQVGRRDGHAQEARLGGA